MSRDVFNMTIASPDPADLLMAYEGVQVFVYERGTTNFVQVFQRSTGVTQGPTPECGATGGPNPFATGPTGNIEFWCDGPKELDVFLHDSIAPQRIADRRIGWNCWPAGIGSIASDVIAADGKLALGSLSAAILRQLTQIGQVIDWWRPPGPPTIPLPLGFVICDGQQVTAGNHDFPGITNFNVPDLRNLMILGADSNKSDQTAAIGDDPAASAPGIRGAGGSNKHTLSSTESGVNPNGSTTHSGGHTHYPMQGRDPYVGPNSPGGTALTYYSDGLNSVYGGVPSDSSPHSHPFNGRAADVAHNNLPKYYGLLKLMKVKRS